MRPLLITAGHCYESPHAAALIEGFAAQVLIADQGDDSDALIEAVTAEGMQAVMPPHPNRIQQREYDRHLDQEHHLIECLINKCNHYRRVFSRVEQLVKNYVGFLSFVNTLHHSNVATLHVNRTQLTIWIKNIYYLSILSTERVGTSTALGAPMRWRRSLQALNAQWRPPRGELPYLC